MGDDGAIAQQTVVVRGLKEFQKALLLAEPSARREVRQALREAATPVKNRAAQLFAPFSAKSAAGYRVAVRQRGVAVEQRLRKTTGDRPQWGALQMTRALLPALEAEEHNLERRVEKALDRVADRLERR